MQWCLEAVADAGRKWLVTIESFPFVIGRADDCDLKLIDKRISKHHSEICDHRFKNPPKSPFKIPPCGASGVGMRLGLI